jgi:hypothetical protein
MDDRSIAAATPGQAEEEEILPSWLVAEGEVSDEALEAAAGTEPRPAPLKLTYAPWKAWCL